MIHQNGAPATSRLHLLVSNATKDLLDHVPLHFCRDYILFLPSGVRRVPSYALDPKQQSHPTMNQCPIHYATMQKSPTYHRSAIDPATTAIAEADSHLVANLLLANLAEVMCTRHHEDS